MQNTDNPAGAAGIEDAGIRDPGIEDPGVEDLADEPGIGGAAGALATGSLAGKPGTTASPAGKPTYREQLSAPKSWYLLAVAFGLCFGLIFLVTDPLWLSPAALVGVSLLGCWAVSAYGKLRIEVAADGITAGAARVPASVLGAASALDREAARALLTYKADARAFLLLRSYVPTGVRVENIDPADQTPYLYLSSRRPEELAAAVNALER